MICGQLMAGGAEFLCHLVVIKTLDWNTGWGLVLSGSMAVTLSTFLMARYGSQHPPAAGTALWVCRSWSANPIWCRNCYF
uniref:HPP family protein n=1 Tax=Candidatus Kentrum sp. TC TaxID=2126339 RepID=A0A450Z5F7_9GAMM|nr:MAG: HPP family protein [Candidatus Kentron sp. TC]